MRADRGRARGEGTASLSWPLRTLVGCLVCLLALLAAGLILFQAAEFVAPHYEHLVEQKLSARLGRPVRVGHLSLGWQSWHPDIRLKSVVVMQKNGVPLVRLGSVEVGINPLPLVKGQVRPTNIRVSGMSVSVVRNARGGLSIAGLRAVLPASGMGNGSIAKYLPKLSAIPVVQIVNTTVQWRDYSHTYAADSLNLSNLRVTLVDGRHFRRLSASAQLPHRLGRRISLGATLTGPAAQPGKWHGSLRLNLQGGRFQPWVARYERPGVHLSGGLDRLQVTGQWRDASLHELQAHARIGPVDAHENGSSQALLPQVVALQLHWRPNANGWSATIPPVQLALGKHAATAGPLHITYTRGGSAGQAGGVYAVSMKTFPLSALHGVAGVLKGNWAAPLAGRSLAGQLQAMNATYSPGGQGAHWRIDGRIDGAGIGPGKRWPGMQGLNASFQATPGSAWLNFAVHDGTLVDPRQFQKPLPLKSLQGRLDWSREHGGWKLAARKVSWQAAGARGGVRMVLSRAQTGNSLQVDMSGHFSVPHVPQLMSHLPRTLSPGLRKWFSKRLKFGSISKGRFSIDGPWRDFPLESGKDGGFKASLQFSGVNLHYADDWPQLKQVSGQLSFKGRAMDVSASNAHIAGVSIDSASAHIADLAHPQLHVDGHTQANAQALIAFIGRMPLKGQYRHVLSSLDAKGPTNVDFKLDMPLYGKQEPVHVDGSVAMHGLTVSYAGMPAPMKDVQGQVNFSENGVAARDIRGTLRGMPVHLSLAPVKSGAGQGENITASGHIALPEDAPAFKGMLSDSLLKRFQGATDWRLSLHAPSDHPVRAIHLQSSLKGMAVNLPAPFAKSADQARPLDVRVNLPPASGQPLIVRMGYGKPVSAVVALGRSKGSMRLLRGELSFGGTRASLPTGTGMVIMGQVDKIDLDAWRKVLPFKSPTGGASSLQELDVEAGLLQIDGQHFKDQHVHAVWSPEGMRIHVHGPQATGQVVWAPHTGTDKRGQVTADFQRLHFSSPFGGNVKKQQQKNPTTYDPRHLPEFNLHCSDCSIEKLNLGTVNVMVQPVPGGEQVQRLQAESKEFSLNATGRWDRHQGLTTAALKLDMHTTDLDELLRVAGFAPTANADHAHFSADVKWLPAAKGISQARLNGHISLALKTGTLRGVDAGGAGKILGLLSFDALPRRLTLDFRDLTSKGLAFDTISGDFQVHSGVAKTDNMIMKAPSLKVTMHGTVNLASHTYDENIHIYPDISAGVTLAGLLLGGPVTGAALFVAQKLFNTPLDKLTELTYHLGGTWKEPVFKLK